MELSTKVMPAFDAIRSLSKLDIHASTLGINIKDSVFGDVKGYYGFYSTGALRIDVNADGDIIQVAIWLKPGDLNKPDYKLDVSYGDFMEHVQEVVRTMNGTSAKLEALAAAESRLYEGAKDDIAEFLAKFPDVASMKGSEAFANYSKWAAKTGHKVMSNVYFANNLRALKANGLVSGSSGKVSPEQTEVEPSEEDSFVKDVMANEIYYKAAMYESLLKRMAKGDPGIVSLFVYGSPGLGKTYTCKKILREAGVWDTKVTYKSGSIAGFTGLLQLLWDNRKGKIIILDDNDSLLVGNIAAANILKAVLNSDPEDRVVSYTRMRR